MREVLSVRSYPHGGVWFRDDGFSKYRILWRCMRTTIGLFAEFAEADPALEQFLNPGGAAK